MNEQGVTPKKKKISILLPIGISAIVFCVPILIGVILNMVADIDMPRIVDSITILISIFTIIIGIPAVLIINAARK